MPWFSMIGEAGIVWFAITIPMLFFKKTRVCAVTMLFSMALVFVVGELGVKYLVGRMRPFSHPDVVIDLLIDKPSGYSFPSSHTGTSFACAVSAFRFNKKFGVVTILIAALIAFSRLYNYVHFPSDVLIGMVFGILSALATAYIFNKFKWDDKILNLFRKK